MPSNKELQEGIVAASIKLGVEADIVGNNSQLAERLKKLNAEVEALPPTPPPAPEGVDCDALNASNPIEGQLVPATDGLDGVLLNPETPNQPPADTPTPLEPIQYQDPAKTVPEVTNPAVEEIQSRRWAIDEEKRVDPVDSEFIVAAGKAISTRRGIISEGRHICARDFTSQEAFEAAVTRKTVVRQ